MDACSSWDTVSGRCHLEGSGAVLNQRLRLLIMDHPRRGGRAAERDQFLNLREVTSQRTLEDGFVVRNTIAQSSQLLQVFVYQSPQLLHSLCGIEVRHDRAQVRVPDPCIETTREHLLPEDHLEFGDDLARAWLASTCAIQLTTLVEHSRIGRVLKTSFEDS